ncbi:MAG: NUDIX hydrolase [Anaerolineae bacterium]
MMLERPELCMAALRRHLSGPLPGKRAQAEMVPEGRSLSPPAHKTAPRASAVLLPLIRSSQEALGLVFTVRRAELTHHGGEISFPGGAVEDADRSYIDTALREAWEEIHLPPDCVDVLGELTPLYIPPSHYLVYPVVGWVPHPPVLYPLRQEVERILTVPLATLLDPRAVRRERWGKRMIPFYSVNGWVIWGATAMILREFLAVLERLEGTFL